MRAINSGSGDGIVSAWGSFVAIAIALFLAVGAASQASAQVDARLEAAARRAAADALRAEAQAAAAAARAEAVAIVAPAPVEVVAGEEIGSLKGIPLPAHVVSLDGAVQPAGMNALIADNDWAIVLGKALFWDEQVGSDGMACASCHFSAGMDSRPTNQLSPGLNDVRFPGGDTQFGGLEQAQGTVANDIGHVSPAGTAGRTAGGQVAGPNITLTADDFPFHKLADIGEHNADILYTTNDVWSSAGTMNGQLVAVNETGGFDDCGPADPAVFNNGHGFAARKVEPRNTPTMINAAFNFENFWDGRAKNVFNGVDPFGNRTLAENPLARIVMVDSAARRVPTSSDLKLAALSVTNSSLASQATGPPLSDFEMSCSGRTFHDLGRKLLSNRALASQIVHAQDSVLGPFSAAGRFFLRYNRLVRLAFDSSLWSGRGRYEIVDNAGQAQLVRSRTGYTQMELNFAMFFGLAIQAYEETLISDDSPMDRHFDDRPGLPNLTPAQLRGLAVFQGKGLCHDCHNTPVMSAASTISMGLEGVIERMPMGGDNGALNPPAVYDNGFYNIGVTRTVADLGRGGTDPYGHPLSFSRQFIREMQGIPAVDVIDVNFCGMEAPFIAASFLPTNPASEVGFIPLDCGEGVVGVQPVLAGTPGAVSTNSLNRNDRRSFVVAIDGSFKTPTIRNVGLTGPYMHDGGMKSLEEVVQFYSRSGNYRSHFLYDTLDALIGDQNACAQVDGLGDLGNSTGTGLLGECDPVPNQLRGSNFDPAIIELALTPGEQADLVQFLLAATDERVACSKAPFDHPSITIRNGASLVDSNGDGRADDVVSFLQAVGAGGRQAEGLACLPNTGNMFNETTLVDQATAAPVR